MSLLELIHAHPEGLHPRDPVAGPVVAIVTNNEDPEGLGRVKLSLPWLSDDNETSWARVCSPMAGAQRGIFFLPEVEDEVLVVFEHGDPRRPVVLGGLWNGVDKPPVANSGGGNHERSIYSRSGLRLQFIDEDGAEKIEISGPDGANQIVIDVAESTISITADADIRLTAPNGTVGIEAQNVEIKATAGAAIEAGSSLEAKAGGDMTLQASTINLN
jgi:uncharacterized protein involved in type VI secretion and phage assembly